MICWPVVRNNTIMNMSFPEIALEDIEALDFDALIDALSM